MNRKALLVTSLFYKRRVYFFLTMLLPMVIMFTACTVNDTTTPPNEVDFLSTMEQSYFPFWLSGEFSSPENIPIGNDSKWYMQGLLTQLREKYNRENGIQSSESNGLPYFTAQEIRDISKDFLGFDYPLLSASEENNPSTNKIFGVLVNMDPHDSLYATIDPSTYNYSDGIITVHANIWYKENSQELNNWIMKYQFSFEPQNEHIPYRFICSEILSGNSW